MADYTIEGTLSEDARVLIIDESDWSLESNTEESSGDYIIEGLNSNSKTVVARHSTGEALVYGNITPIETTCPAITLPYDYTFSDLSNGFTLQESNHCDWMSKDDKYPVFSDSVESYDSSWTGGFVFNSQDSTYMISNFSLKGNFSQAMAYLSPENPFQSVDPGGITHSFKIRDVANRNYINIWYGSSDGHKLWVTVARQGVGTHEVNAISFSDYEAELRIDRSGNSFTAWLGNTSYGPYTIADVGAHMLMEITSGYWTTAVDQDFMLDRLRIGSGTVVYPEIQDFTGENGAAVDSSFWEDQNPSNPTVIDTNRAKQHLESGMADPIIRTVNAISGDFSVSVDWEIGAGASSTWWYQYIELLWNNDDDSTWIGRSYSSEGGVGHKVVTYSKDEGVSTLGDYTNNTDTSGTFVLVRTGSTIRTYWKSTNVGWTLWNSPVSVSGDVDIRLVISNGDNDPTTTVYWDNFRLYN
jgi:hypothetical protein